MRQFLNRTTTLLLLAASLSVGIVGSAAAQAPTDVPSGDTCVGSWLTRITPLGQPASASRAGVGTFNSDGTFIEASQPVVPGPPDAPDNVNFSSSGQGAWQATDTGCAVTFVFQNADAKGNLAATIEIRITFVVGPDGNTLTTDGTDFATVTAPDGTVVFSGPGNTVEGTRIVVKSAPPASSASPSQTP